MHYGKFFVCIHTYIWLRKLYSNNNTFAQYINNSDPLQNTPLKISAEFRNRMHPSLRRLGRKINLENLSIKTILSNDKIHKNIMWNSTQLSPLNGFYISLCSFLNLPKILVEAFRQIFHIKPVPEFQGKSIFLCGIWYWGMKCKIPKISKNRPRNKFE